MLARWARGWSSGRVLVYQVADARERGLDVLAGTAADRAVGLDDRGTARGCRLRVRHRQQVARHFVAALGQIVAELAATSSVEVRPVGFELADELGKQLPGHVVGVARHELVHRPEGELDRGPGDAGHL